MMKTEPFSAALPYRQFLEGHQGVVDLREEGVLQGCWLTGPSPDSDSSDTILQKAEQLGVAPVHFRNGDSIQIIFDREPAPEPPVTGYIHPVAQVMADDMRSRFTAEEHWITPARLYFSHHFERPVARWFKTLMLAGNGPQQLSNHRLLAEYALGRFQAFRNAVQGAIGLRPMTNQETLQDLLRSVTYRTHPIAMPAAHVRLNHVLDADYQINGRYPMMGDWHLRPFVIKTYPSMVLPQILSVLLNFPGHLTLSIRYQCYDPYTAQAEMDKQKPLWRQTVIGSFLKLLKSMLRSRGNAGERDASRQIDEIDEAQTMSQEGTSFGIVQTIGIVRNRNPEVADLQLHNLMGALAGSGIIAWKETIGAEKAIRKTWPGALPASKDSYEATRHRIIMSGYNYADIGMPRNLWEGLPFINSNQFPPGTPTPFVCSGSAGEPFYYPIAINGVMHFLGIGMTGSGKTTWINAYICALLGIPNLGHITLMDSSLAKSSFVFSHLIGAEYHEVGAPNATPLCPLALLDTPGGLQWLAGWFERVFYRRRNFELGETASKTLMNALQDVRMRKDPPVDDPECRTLLSLYAALHGGTDETNRMRKILDEMMSYYGHILNGKPVHTAQSPVSVYQLSELNGVPKYISTPAKEIILQNAIVRLDGRPSWFIWDEFWDAVGDETSADWAFGAIRTMRGLNCGFGGLTQSSIEITQNERNCNVLLGNIPALLFFPNPSASTSYIARSLTQLGLNDHEITSIASAAPGAFFYKSYAGSRLASNRLSEIGQVICAATSQADGNLARDLLQQCSHPDEFPAAWLAAHGIQAQGLPGFSTGQVTDGRRAGNLAA